MLKLTKFNLSKVFKKISAGVIILAIFVGVGIYFFLQNEKNVEPEVSSPLVESTENVEFTSAEPTELVAANNQFAFELFEKYSDADENIFFSPFSISSALAMTFEGARGTTADEMRSVFHFPENAELRQNAFRTVFAEINRSDKNYKLATANALWAQNNYQFSDEYFTTMENFYDGEIRNLDFKNDTENSRLTINSWVEEKTKNKIKNLIEQLSPMTKLVLTNAIYFKGDWAEQFDKNSTRDREFELISGEKIETPTMYSSDDFNNFENENWQILEIP